MVSHFISGSVYSAIWVTWLMWVQIEINPALPWTKTTLQKTQHAHYTAYTSTTTILQSMEFSWRLPESETFHSGPYFFASLKAREKNKPRSGDFMAASTMPTSSCRLLGSWARPEAKAARASAWRPKYWRATPCRKYACKESGRKKHTHTHKRKWILVSWYIWHNFSTLQSSVQQGPIRCCVLYMLNSKTLNIMLQWQHRVAQKYDNISVTHDSPDFWRKAADGWCTSELW